MSTPHTSSQQSQPTIQHGHLLQGQEQLLIWPAAAVYPALHSQIQLPALMALGSIKMHKVSLWSKRIQNKTLFSFLFPISLILVNSFRPTVQKILICCSVTVPSMIVTKRELTLHKSSSGSFFSTHLKPESFIPVK